MLLELNIRDFVIVQSVCLRLGKGFHVLTGETGAGKSILIDALSLVLGARATADVVRSGAARADIDAVVQPTAAIVQWLKDNDLDQDEETEQELILRRVVDKHGKSRAYINGTPVTVAQLREIGQQLVDIHGQHAHQSLMRADAQRDLLDAHLKLNDLRQTVRQTFEAWQTACQRHEQASQGAKQRQEQLDALAWQVQELQTLAPEPGQWNLISQEHARLSNGQALIDAAARALAAIDDDESGAQRGLAQALEQIRQAHKHDPKLENIRQALESADIALSEARSDLSHYVDDLDLDPARLAELDARMQALFSAARKFRCEPDELPELLERAQEQMLELQEDQDIEALHQRQVQAEQDYDKQAAALRAARSKGVKPLVKAVTTKMQALGMPGGQFAIEIEPAPRSANGADRITFLASGHEGVAPGPLNKTASGGELSRISLALSVVASLATHIPTLVFDEVDTGVSGAVAEMVGRLLHELGQHHQVLCVTHLPQVAACAEQHYQVTKQKQTNGVVGSALHHLNDEARVQAIAELLGGVDITDTTRSHARELLASARG